jgi:hypothetical protein
MRSSHGVVLSVIVATLVLVPGAKAFLDEIAQLRGELQLYQTTHAANFADLVSKLDEIAGPSFQDVEDGEWFYKYIASVANWGIVSGYSDENGDRTGIFGPQNPVTIAETLKMSFKSAQIDEAECSTATPKQPQAITHWSKPFVACAEQMGVRLFKDGRFVNLDRPASRAEALSIIDDVFGETVPRIFSEFPDTRGHTYEADVAYAVMRGIVSGDKDSQGRSLGTFRPDDSVNRAEMSKLIFQQLKSRIQLQVKAQ